MTFPWVLVCVKYRNLRCWSGKCGAERLSLSHWATRVAQDILTKLELLLVEKCSIGSMIGLVEK